MTGKTKYKEKFDECQIVIASCDHLEMVCHQLMDQVAELEVELDKCRMVTVHFVFRNFFACFPSLLDLGSLV